MSERSIRILALLMTLVGLAAIAYKHLVAGLPLVPGETVDTFAVEARLHFYASRGPVKAQLAIPKGGSGYDILDESFGSPGFGVTTRDEGDGRLSVWAKRRASGEQTLYYRAVIYASDAESYGSEPPFPKVPDYPEPYGSAARSLLDEVREDSADIVTFTAELVERLNTPAAEEHIRLLRSSGEGPPSLAATAVYVLAGARIPARVVQGLYLSERERHAELIPWLQVYDGSAWHFVDPESGSVGRPEGFFVWHPGDGQLHSLEGGRRDALELSVIRNVMDAQALAMQRAEGREGSPQLLSLLNLPIRTQAVYQILLLLPFGAFVVAVARNVVGLKTTGTFMPALIALAFRETRLVWGVLLFVAVVVVGLALRSALDRLKLLLVPRLGAVLTTVILLLAVLSMVSHRVGLEPGISVGLFPVVILVITIERLSIVWDERGLREAAQEGATSLLVSIIAYFVMTRSGLQHFVFVFPESLLILFGGFLVLGRYSGYRFMEIQRFRSLLGESG